MAEQVDNDELTEDEPENWALRNPGLTVLLVAGGAVAVMVAYAVSWHFWTPGKMSDRGAFGDAFAPVVGLISSLALGAAVLSVFIQRRELALQRKELRATRIEAKRQREAAEALANETKRANDLAGHQNDTLRRANALAEQQLRSQGEAQKLALFGQRLTVSAELQRWDDIGLREFPADKWVSWIHKYDSMSDIPEVLANKPNIWLVAKRVDARDRLVALVEDYEKRTGDSLTRPSSHRRQ